MITFFRIGDKRRLKMVIRLFFYICIVSPGDNSPDESLN